MTNALTGTTVITYNALGQRVGVMNENGKSSYTAFDGLGRTIVMTDATGSVTRYGYDAIGNRVKVIDGLNRPMTSTYDAASRLILMQDALGNRTRYGYDGLDNRVVMTDATGVITRYGYDALNRLVAVTESVTSTVGLDPAQYNVVTRYGYDAMSNRTVITNARGYTTTYTYDSLSRLLTMTDPLTHTTRYQYDAVGNRTKVIDANNQTTVYTYDVINRNTKIDYGTSLVTFQYDQVGNRQTMTDSLGVTRYLYDELNRLKQVTDPFTGTVQYRYDAVGNRTQTIYPDGKTVTDTFDAANRLTGTLSWDGQATTYAFDKAGRLVTTTLPNGVRSVNGYDAAGRLVNLTHLGPYWLLATYTYTLDAVGNRLAVQERVLPPTPLTYLPVILNDFDESGGQMMPGGQTSPFVSPLATPAPFQSPLLPASSLPPNNSTAPLFDPSLLIIAPVALAAVVARRKGRKGALLIAALAGTLVTIGLTQTGGAMPAPMPFLSPSGGPPPGCTLPTAVGDTRVISYTYDPLSRLTSAAYSSGECYQYSYDRVSNRTAMTTTVGATTYQYDPANRLSSVNGQTYAWDNNGNLLNDGSANYLYDRANRLISTTLSGATTLFNYNGDGVRLKQIVGSEVTTYTQDLAAPLPVVLQSKTGVTTTKYLYATDTRPLAQNATAWEYLLPDALGSVRQINSADGYIVRTQDYEPYGSVLNSDGSGNSVYGFAGEERDQSGLIFLRARYLNPLLGLFLTEDTARGIAALPLSMQLYLYAWANPVDRIDPSGLQSLPPKCNFGDICASGPTGPYTPPTPPIDPYYHPQNPYPAGEDPVFGGPDFLGSLPPILPSHGSWYDPLGIVAQYVASASDQFEIPREFVAAVLNYENHQEKGLGGALTRLGKRIINFCLQPLDDLIGRKYDNGLSFSQGIGNVKPTRAGELEDYFMTHYDPASQEHQALAAEQPGRATKLAFDNTSVLYVAAGLRYAADALYEQSYQGPISQEGARRILGANNLPSKAINGVETEAGNEGITLLIRAARGEVPLPFFPGR